MKALSTALLLFIASTLLCGCAGEKASNKVSAEQQAIDQVATPFAQGAIALNITADPGLNSWNEIANSCTLLVIQAQNASSLNKVLSNPAQLKSLFNGAGAENDILKVDRYATMPGQQITLHIDRSENTRKVAIVAGYWRIAVALRSLQPDRLLQQCQENADRPAQRAGAGRQHLHHPEI